LKLLFISNLFPDRQEPNRGLVNARLLRHMAGGGEIRVIAPRPSLKGWLREDAGRQCLPTDEEFQPLYPLVPYIPKWRGRINDQLFGCRLRKWVNKVRQDFPFEAILCSWLYPDAVAMSRLAKELDLPLVAIAQGSDIHQYLKLPARAESILATVSQCAQTITRSQELARLLIAAKVPEHKVQVVYNGVETAVFHPGNRTEARGRLGLPATAKIVLYVGNLLPVKNPRLALDSFHRLVGSFAPCENVRLVLVGTGFLEPSLRQQAEQLGIANSLVWAGSQPPAQVADYLRAADVLCVPSENEGLPNVLLEALASGIPTVATRVGGIPEVLNRPELGRLVTAGDSEAMAKALADVLSGVTASGAIAEYGAKFSWGKTVETYWTILHEARQLARAGEGRVESGLGSGDKQRGLLS
jgi:teichuronic acid biosynthesis glycosyltransferase TuaC